MTIPDTIKVPQSVEEAFALLDAMLDSADKKAIMDGADTHMGLGLWIRNEWLHGPENGEGDALCADLVKVLDIPAFMLIGDVFSSKILELYEKHLMKV